MNHRDHILKARSEMEERHLIVIGQGVVVYDAENRAWALPGGYHTTHRPAAEHAARMIDLIATKQIVGPKIIK